MKTIGAANFKARCLAVLDEVAEARAEYTILKHGRPVARLLPPGPAGVSQPQATLAGTVHVLGDIVAPPLADDDWEANAGPQPRRPRRRGKR